MFSYTVKEACLTTPSVLALTLRSDDPSNLCTFLPGQYAAIRFVSKGRPTTMRCFSLASDPAMPEEIQFGIRVGGAYTSRLSKILPGEKVTLQGPFGGFVLDPNTQKNVVFCAGGIGITPFLSMIRHATTTKSDISMQLLYSVRNQDDIAFRDELQSLASQNQNFGLNYVVSDGDTNKLQPYKCFTGRLNSDILSQSAPVGPQNTHFFLCGPPPYMHAVIDNLRSLGVPPEQIITEAFSQGTGGGTRKPHGLQINAYALGGLSTVVAALVMLAGDIVRTVPNQLLPETLSDQSSDEKLRSTNARQNDLDNLIRNLRSDQTTLSSSPSVIDAQKEVADAQAKIAEVNAQNAAIQTGTAYVAPKYTVPTSVSTTTTTTAPAPTPTPTPTCTTSPSGVRTCV